MHKHYYYYCYADDIKYAEKRNAHKCGAQMANCADNEMQNKMKQKKIVQLLARGDHGIALTLVLVYSIIPFLADNVTVLLWIKAINSLFCGEQRPFFIRM